MSAPEVRTARTGRAHPSARPRASTLLTCVHGVMPRGGGRRRQGEEAVRGGAVLRLRRRAPSTLRPPATQLRVSTPGSTDLQIGSTSGVRCARRWRTHDSARRGFAHTHGSGVQLALASLDEIRTRASEQHGGIPLTPKSSQKTRALSFVAAR